MGYITGQRWAVLSSTNVKRIQQSKGQGTLTIFISQIKKLSNFYLLSVKCAAFHVKLFHSVPTSDLSVCGV